MRKTVFILFAVFLLSFSYAFAATDLINGIFAYWDFETDPDVADLEDQVNNNDSLFDTVRGRVAGVNNYTDDGVDKYGWDFEQSAGDGDSVTLQEGILQTFSTYSISCWFKVEDNKTDATVFGWFMSGGYVYAMGIPSTGDDELWWRPSFDGGYDSVTNTTLTIDNGVWYQIGITYSEDVEAVGYFNGQISAQFLPSNVQLPDDNSCIGASGNCDTSDFDGVIDECGVWDRVLTLEEMELLASNTTLGFWPFVLADSATPGYFNYSNDAGGNTTFGQKVTWNITFTDDLALTHYIFSNNLSGSWSNASNTTLSDAHAVVNESLTVDVLTDQFFCGRFYVFDGVGNENATNLSCFQNEEIFNLKTILTDSSGDLLNINSLSELEIFHINANFTQNDTSLIGASCNFTAENISGHFQVTGSDTIIDTGSSLNLTIDETPTNLVDDTINFKICRNNLKAAVNIYVNDTLNYSINQNVIPLCSIGTHEENRVTTDFTGLKNFIISVRCDGCTGGREMNITADDDGILMSIDRMFTSHSEALPYNSTLELYVHRNHFYNYGKQFNDITLDITCNQTTNSTMLSVGDISPIITILSIDETPYTSGMQVESNESTIISIDVSGDIIETISLNVTYDNGSVIKTSSTESITLNQTELNINHIYNITIAAIDDEGNTTFLSDTFQLNDTTDPIISWIFPNTLNTSTGINDTSLSLNISISDINLFAYEALLYSPTGALRANFTDTGLSVTSLVIENSFTFNETGKWVVALMISDDHTSSLIDDYDFEIYEKEFDKKSIRFDFEDIIDNVQYKSNVTIEYIGQYVTNYLVLDKLEDRYTFEYVFDLENDIDNKEVRHRFRITCSDMYYRPKSEYTAHFVCYDAKKWIDFESPDVIDYFIEECGEGCYEIELITESESSIKFNSIGGLNIIEEHKSIDIAATPSDNPYNINLFAGNLFNKDIIDTGTIAGVLILFFLLLCLGGMIFMGEHLQIPVVAIMAGIFGVFFGILVYVAVSAILGVILIFMSIGVIVRGGMMTL